MSKEFKRLSSHKKIESPIAKYNSVGQLTCIICNQVVKSELMWNAHINSKSHLEAKNQLKMKLIAEQAIPISQDTNTNSNTTVITQLKEKPASSLSEDNKQANKTASITTGLKRPNTESSKSNNTNSEILNKKQKLDQIIKKTDSIDLNQNKTEPVKSNQGATPVTIEPAAENGIVGTALPEGFFDDPDLDAKIRGQSREANLEAEYEEFKKVIQNEEFKSDILIEQDDKLRDFERDIEEVDELIDRWNKIENLHQRREAIKQQQASDSSKMNKKIAKKQEIKSEDDDDEEVDLENVLNLALRSKNRF